MKKYFIALLLVAFLLSGCNSTDSESELLSIAVTIAPQKRFVEKVAGNKAKVVTMIPAGNSPANYQPSPKEMIIFDSADIYFSIGVAAESNIKPLIKNEDIQKVYLEEIVSDIYFDRFFEEDDHDGHDEHTGRDPHIWLSPKRVILMVESIMNELIKEDPINASYYKENAKLYINDLIGLDQYLKDIFSSLGNKEFIIYHPSFGYFADEYGLNMIAIEEDGKEATARRLEEIIDMAIQSDIKFILYQEEFDSQQAELIAKEIGGTAIKVNPLSEDYINNLKNIGDNLLELLN